MKKSGKGWHEWHKACLDSGVFPQKFKTPVKIKFASCVILFQETLEFKHTISLCYGRQTTLALQACMPSPQVWATAQVVANTLGFVVQQRVLNQSRDYWLLSDAFSVTISLVCKLKVDCLTPNANETQDFDGELITLQKQMQK